MNVISDFNFELNKDKIISSVQSYCQSPPYEALSKIYDNILPLVKKSSEPLALFKLEKKSDELNLMSLKDCKFVVYCAVTIGQNSVDKVDSLFKDGKFYEAILFDAIASHFLFDISDQLFTKICRKYNDINLGLTNKIVPGDGNIDLEYQREIISRLENNSISIVNKYMLYPSKSMSYIYGADEKIEYNQYKDHSCVTCTNIFCTMKNAKDNTELSVLSKTMGCA